MKTIKHDTNQYFIIDGNNVYASLNPNLKQNEFIILTREGEQGLNVIRDFNVLRLVYVFDFLNHLSQTPVIVAGHQEQDGKTILMDALYDYFEFFREFFDNGCYYYGYHKNDERRKSFLENMRNHQKKVDVVHKGNYYLVPLKMDGFDFEKRGVSQDTDKNLFMFSFGEGVYKKTYAVEADPNIIHQPVCEHIWACIRKQSRETSVSVK